MQRGGDLESQGSYMMKANNANLDDMQSMGSYMVRREGPTEEDEMEEQAEDGESEFARGNADDM